MYDKKLSQNWTTSLAWLIAAYAVIGFVLTAYFVIGADLDVDPHSVERMWFRAVVGVAFFGGVPGTFVVIALAVGSSWKHLPIWCLLMSLALASFTPISVQLGVLVFL